jgi:hypothetical protein
MNIGELFMTKASTGLKKKTPKKMPISKLSKKERNAKAPKERMDVI